MFSDLVSNTLRKFQEKKVMPNLCHLMESKERVSYLHMVFLLLLIFLAGFLLHWSLFLFFFFFRSMRSMFIHGLHTCWLRSILWVVNVQPTSQLWTALCSAQLDDTLTPFVCQIMLLQPWTTEMIRFGNWRVKCNK